MIGERIKACREKIGISQEELAHRIGMHSNTVARWERGELDPRGTSTSKLARALNTTVGYLVGETDEPHSPNEYGLNHEIITNANNVPYTKEQSLNSGMLILTFNNGEKLELPPTKASYDFLKEMTTNAFRTVSVAVS